MSKITVKDKHGETQIINRLSYPEMVNERIYNTMITNTFDFFLPISLIKKKKEMWLECTAAGLIPVKWYFNGTVTKRMFLDLAYRLASIIKECEKNRINVDNLYLRKECVYVDPVKRTIKCIYWPVVNNKNGASPYTFFRQLTYEVNFNSYEDNTYIKKYNEFFEGNDLFSVNSFEKLILELQGKKTNGDNDARAVFLSEPSASKNKVPSGLGLSENSNSNVEYDPLANNNDAFVKDKYPVLIQKRTGEAHRISKNAFRIGKDSEQCDFSIIDNRFISRLHAMIIQKNGYYYVVDMGSTNRTFVDGKMIEKNVEVRITDGSRLSFANEEFVFSLHG